MTRVPPRVWDSTTLCALGMHGRCDGTVLNTYEEALEGKSDRCRCLCHTHPYEAQLRRALKLTVAAWTAWLAGNTVALFHMGPLAFTVTMVASGLLTVWFCAWVDPS